MLRSIARIRFAQLLAERSRPPAAKSCAIFPTFAKENNPQKRRVLLFVSPLRMFSFALFGLLASGSAAGGSPVPRWFCPVGCVARFPLAFFGFCRFAQEVVNWWSSAEQIGLVQDNLNTHNAGSFYENLPPEEAFALSQRFEFHYTPKKGSWLNMAELELSALSRVCLARRIPDMVTLSGELESIVRERNDLEIKVKWQFTVEQANRS